jgi:uncharacterized protein GlcG (DUF336 family)
LTIKCTSVSLLAVVPLAAWAASALAQDLVTNRNISLAMAAEAATAAVEQCQRDGFRATATVVDSAGHIKSVMRADGAGPHTVDSSRRKAYTSLSVGGSTGELDTFLRERSPFPPSVCGSSNKCCRFLVDLRSVRATKWSEPSASAARQAVTRTSAVRVPESKRSRVG